MQQEFLEEKDDDSSAHPDLCNHTAFGSVHCWTGGVCIGADILLLSLHREQAWLLNFCESKKHVSVCINNVS